MFLVALAKSLIFSSKSSTSMPAAVASKPKSIKYSFNFSTESIFFQSMVFRAFANN
jgi:hypothetical protein